MARRSSNTLSIVTIALCSTTIGLLLHEAWSRRAGTLPPDSLTALRLVHHRILEDYVFERDPEELVYRAIEGMVDSLDDYSRFVPPDQVRTFEEIEITGTYEGIGVLLWTEQVPPVVRWPFPGGPAERAGLRVGDRLLAVDGEPIDRANAVEKLRGPEDSAVRILVERTATEPFEATVERGAVRKPAVKWATLLGDDSRIGYVYVGEFQRGMVDAFDEEIAWLRQRAGGELQGLVVDVRSNSGGLLEEAVQLTNRLLPEGTIVSLKRRDGQTIETHEADPERCTLRDVPAIVIVDRRSASAAEVFAAALQDHGRAKLVGERTFGKGVVQQIYQWSGFRFRLKMTSSHYYTPNGRNISKTLRRDEDGDDPGGVDPDVAIALTREQVESFRAHLLETFETPREYLEEVEELAADLGFEVPRSPSPDTDPCLAAALATLTDGERSGR